MKKAYIFPGQGAQFVGMGKQLLESEKTGTIAKEYLDKANDLLGFDIKGIMSEGTEEDLKQTKVTQPAIFLHSIILAETEESFEADAVAGHSLGEFSALTAAGYLAFEDALQLVSTRARAMQKSCEENESTMAAILGLEDAQVEDICKDVNETVVAANYNCPGQLVISGSKAGVEIAVEKAKEAGARRALLLPVGGGFHSPMMESARVELALGIEKAQFKQGICPIYQNVTAESETNTANIKANLIKQLTAPVKWTQTVQRMIADDIEVFYECGPGKVLSGLVKKINRTVSTDQIKL